MAQSGVVGLEFCLNEFVAIKIDETDVAMQELIAEARLMEEQFRVAMMTGAFSDGYGGGSQPQKGFGCGADQVSVRVHRSPWNVFHQIGLEQDGFPTDVQAEKPYPVINQPVEFVGVLVRR